MAYVLWHTKGRNFALVHFPQICAELNARRLTLTNASLKDQRKSALANLQNLREPLMKLQLHRSTLAWYYDQ